MSALTTPRRGLELPDPGDFGDPPPGVDSVLAEASALRFPDLSQKSGREKVEALADHIMQTAITRGELEELRLEAHVALYAARKRLGRLPAASSKGKVADEARRAADPELADEIDHHRWVVDRCTEQINRLGGTDYDAASRCYTLLGG